MEREEIHISKAFEITANNSGCLGLLKQLNSQSVFMKRQCNFYCYYGEYHLKNSHCIALGFNQIVLILHSHFNRWEIKDDF